MKLCNALLRCECLIERNFYYFFFQLYIAIRDEMRTRILVWLVWIMIGIVSSFIVGIFCIGFSIFLFSTGSRELTMIGVRVTFIPGVIILTVNSEYLKYFYRCSFLIHRVLCYAFDTEESLIESW